VNIYWRGLPLFLCALNSANHSASFQKSDTINLYVLSSIYVFCPQLKGCLFWYLAGSFICVVKCEVIFHFYFVVLMETLLHISRKQHHAPIQHFTIAYISTTRTLDLWSKLTSEDTTSFMFSAVILCKLLLTIRIVETSYTCTHSNHSDMEEGCTPPQVRKELLIPINNHRNKQKSEF
jgi:hypothetical protein